MMDVGAWTLIAFQVRDTKTIKSLGHALRAPRSPCGYRGLTPRRISRRFRPVVVL